MDVIGRRRAPVVGRGVSVPATHVKATCQYAGRGQQARMDTHTRKVIWYDRLQIALSECEHAARITGDHVRARRLVPLLSRANDRSEMLAGAVA